jgi:hypothetical protein
MDRREAENLLLGRKDMTMREFEAMRKLVRKLPLYPESQLPMDQQPPGDYCRIKNREIDPWTKRRR